MQVKLKNVKANPFRNIDGYPINRDKVEQLKKSIKSTDFWSNIVARESGRGIEIAYGHHRLAALREIYPESESFEFIVRDLDDAQMIKIMAHENLDDWGHDSAMERETIRAVIEAYGAGKISLPKPKESNGKVRYAPSFCLGNNNLTNPEDGSSFGLKPYNADTVAAFLGSTMPIATVKYTIRALCLIEQGHIEESHLGNLTSNKARQVVDSATKAVSAAKAIVKQGARTAMTAATPTMEKKIKKDAAQKAKATVKKITGAVSESLKRGGSAADAKEAAFQAKVSIVPKGETSPDISPAALTLAGKLRRMLDPEYAMAKELLQVIKFKKHLSSSAKTSLIRSLEELIEYAQGYIAKLEK